jgi:hypothetical protein
VTLDVELKVYELIDKIAPFYMELVNITRVLLRLIPVDNGKLTESKLPTLERLIADLLDHDKELKRTERVNLTLGRRSVSQTSNGSSQQSSNGKNCSHYKRDGHIEKDCWQKHPEKRPKSGDRRKYNMKHDDNKSSLT